MSKKRSSDSKYSTKKIQQMHESGLPQDPEFWSQIPNWEKKEELELLFDKKDWIDAKAVYSEHDLIILGESVMEDWETPYMQVLARIAAEKGGTILELGFGMGIASRFIQEYNIVKHIIIEANRHVAEMARKFAASSVCEVEILEGFWEDLIETIPDNSIDGILFDTYPLEVAELYQNHFKFFPFAYKKLKMGGVFTYYSDEIDGFSEVHLRNLLSAGFKQANITSEVVPISPPPGCVYWKANTILAPIVRK